MKKDKQFTYTPTLIIATNAGRNEKESALIYFNKTCSSCNPSSDMDAPVTHITTPRAPCHVKSIALNSRSLHTRQVHPPWYQLFYLHGPI
jgi:hypothetical protein